MFENDPPIHFFFFFFLQKLPSLTYMPLRWLTPKKCLCASRVEKSLLCRHGVSFFFVPIFFFFFFHLNQANGLGFYNVVMSHVYLHFVKLLLIKILKYPVTFLLQFVLILFITGLQSFEYYL